MYIDIYVLRIYCEVDKIRHLLTVGQQSVIRAHHRLMEIRVLHIASVYKEILQ